MSDNEHNISWGKVLTGAAIAAAAVSVVAIFPASLGAVGSFIAANPALTIGSAAFAGGTAVHMTENRKAASQASLSHTERLDEQRMEERMLAQMEAAGCQTCPGKSI